MGNADKKCKTEAVIYKWTPTSHTYIGKSQGHLPKRINQHINKLVAVWNLRDKHNKNIAKGSARITPKGSYTNTARIITIGGIMTTHLAKNPDVGSNDETDDETTMSSSEDETTGEEISQELTPKTNFQNKFGRPADKKTT